MLSRAAYRAIPLLPSAGPMSSKSITIPALSTLALPHLRPSPSRALSSTSTSLSSPSSPSSSTLPSTLSDSEKIRVLREDAVAPATGRPLSAIAADIWDHNTAPVGPGHRSGRKILNRPLKGPLYASWYPEAPGKNPRNPFKLTDKQERWKEKLAILRASGRGPPKKGAGKRSK